MGKKAAQKTEKPKKTAAAAVLITAIVIVLLAAGNIIQWKRAKDAEAALPAITPISDPEVVEVTPEITLTSALIAEKLTAASDLVSSEYVYTYYNTYEKSQMIGNYPVPFTTDKSLYIFNGKILAGIDMSRIEINVDNEKKTIILDLPDAKMISNQIDYDSFQVFNLKDSIFTSTSLEEYAELQSEVERLAEQKFWNADAKKKTLENAKAAIRGLLELSDLTKDYTIKFV